MNKWRLTGLFSLMWALMGGHLLYGAGGGFQADRMLLTWREDPTSTMVIQWMSMGKPLPVREEGIIQQGEVPAIPQIAVAPVDASAKWWDSGLVLDYFADTEHRRPQEEDFHVEARLGWNENGLLLLVKVQDDQHQEEPQNLWNGDSLELFISDGVGSNYRYQMVLAAGMDAEHPTPRHAFFAKPGGPKKEELTTEYAVRKTDEGHYFVEILLPWSNLQKLQPQPGTPIGLQLYVNDADKGKSRRWVGLHPDRTAAERPEPGYAFELGEKQNGLVHVRAAIEYAASGTQVNLYVPTDWMGRKVELLSGNQVLASGVLQEADTCSQVTIEVPNAPGETQWGRLWVNIDGKRTSFVEIATDMFYYPVPDVPLSYWTDANPAQRKEVTVVGSKMLRWPGAFLYRVELTGLQEDTLYRFQAAEHERVFAFRTMPQQLNRTLRIAMGGDTRARQDWMEAMNRVVLSYNPDFIVWGGDLAYANSDIKNLKRWEEWFSAIHNTLIDEDGRVVPILSAIGNHEVIYGYYLHHKEYQQTDEWRHSIAHYYYQIFPFPAAGYGVMDVGDYLSFILLDTDHTNPVQGRQTEWLSQALKERRDRPYVFPVYHVPAYPGHRSESATSKRIKQLWLPLFEQNGIRLAYEHHDHVYKRTVPIRGDKPHPEGIVYVGDGAWGVKERSVLDVATTWYLTRAESVRHAIIMTLQPGQREKLVMVSVDGVEFDRYPEEPQTAEQTSEQAAEE
jgi:hypothetical protein